MKKDTQLPVRVTSLEKQGFERAAEIAGIGLSAWARERLRSCAIKELQEHGEKVIFLNPVKLETKNK